YATHAAGDTWYRLLQETTGVAAAAMLEQAIVVGTHAGAIYRSEDQGRTWRGLAWFATPHPLTRFVSLDPLSPSSTLLVGTGNGSVALTQNGAECHVRAVGLQGHHITSLASTRNAQGNPVLFASTWRDAVFRSEDVGGSWERHGAGLTTDRQAD